MTPSEFTAFMNGVVLATPSAPPTPEQWAEIRTKLESVFTKVTPDRSARRQYDPTLATSPYVGAGPHMPSDHTC